MSYELLQSHIKYSSNAAPENSLATQSAVGQDVTRNDSVVDLYDYTAPLISDLMWLFSPYGEPLP
jgi:hypothetical protein